MEGEYPSRIELQRVICKSNILKAKYCMPYTPHVQHVRANITGYLSTEYKVIILLKL
jgi:hypothetical protein